MTKYFTEKQINTAVDKGKTGRYPVAPNIYLLVKAKNIAIWNTRFQIRGKRIEKKIATFGENNPHFMSYQSAINKSVQFQRVLTTGQNPLERTHTAIQNLSDLVDAYIDSQSCKYTKELEIFKRDISPVLGEKLLTNITRHDLEMLLKVIVNSGRKSIARKALTFFRTIFRYASDHNLIIENVASHLKHKHHAGGSEEARQVVLPLSEIEKMFAILQQFPKQAPLRSRIAITFYLIFGPRKCELLSAKWADFSFINKEWILKTTKMGDDSITIKVPDAVVPLFETLKQLSKGSVFIFPTARGSKSGHLSESTLNNMLLKFFSEYQTKSVYFNNPFGEAGIRKFCVHDLRRTFSTTAIDNEVDEVVVDRCLNHKKRNSTRPYDVSNRDLQRSSVYKMLADIVLPLTGLEARVIHLNDRAETKRAA
ncbi:tyrosine-type recombinase/integrase [Alteromonadaceae bacterium BrNp21-10]|nr:tyrosine-type recombinase/integrase [Alteromonadaceae bacterium BrNp21-10]